MTMTTNQTDVFIITEKGKTYSSEGQAYVAKKIKKHGIDDNLSFHMGASFNKPSILIDALKTSPHAYVTVSENEHITIFYDDNIEAIINMLSDFPNDSC